MCHINTVVECGPPSNITNGQVDYTGITYWSTANYSCDIGYRLAGSEVKICQDSKMWTPNDTECNSETIHMTTLDYTCRSNHCNNSTVQLLTVDSHRLLRIPMSTSPMELSTRQ